MKIPNRVITLTLAGVVVAGSAARIAQACGDEEATNEAQVGRWSITSSEVEGEEDATSRRFPHFKLAHLMDNNAATPWVFRGQGRKDAFNVTWGNRHALQFDHNGAVFIDEIRIMNGYNKRPDLFWRNDRVIEIGVALDFKKVKRARLSDKMGWHSVSVPRRKVSSVHIEMIGIRKGSGADNDICLSEVAFYNRGRRITP